jgi:hypothetical protein
VQLGMFLAAAEKRGRGLDLAEGRAMLVASGLRSLGVAKCNCSVCRRSPEKRVFIKAFAGRTVGR